MYLSGRNFMTPPLHTNSLFLLRLTVWVDSREWPFCEHCDQTRSCQPLRTSSLTTLDSHLLNLRPLTFPAHLPTPTAAPRSSSCCPREPTPWWLCSSSGRTTGTAGTGFRPSRLARGRWGVVWFNLTQSTVIWHPTAVFIEWYRTYHSQDDRHCYS